MNVKGVKRAAFITPDGESAHATFTEKAGFGLAALSVYEIGYISRLLQMDVAGMISLVKDKTRIILVRSGDNISYIEFDARHQLDTILPYVEQILTSET